MNSGSILFVDDEENILKSLTRHLHFSDFRILTALSGSKALDILEKEEIDIVISDFRMPEMDGIKLLKQVRNKYPEINRIILSGFIDRTIVLESLVSGVASTFLAKPWDDEELEDKIKSLLLLRKKLKEKNVLKELSNITTFPTRKDIINKITSTINEENALEKIVNLIEKDVFLSARILQIANSALWEKKGISSIRDAMKKLEINIIKDILINLPAEDNLNDISGNREYQKILKRSVIMEKLLPHFAKYFLKTTAHHDFPSIGLIYKTGEIIKERYLRDKDISVPEIGGMFLELWNMPGILVESALYYQNPQSAKGENKDLIVILNYLDNLISNIDAEKDRKLFDRIYLQDIEDEEINKIALYFQDKYGTKIG